MMEIGIHIPIFKRSNMYRERTQHLVGMVTVSGGALDKFKFLEHKDTVLLCFDLHLEMKTCPTVVESTWMTLRSLQVQKRTCRSLADAPSPQCPILNSPVNGSVVHTNLNFFPIVFRWLVVFFLSC